MSRRALSFWLVVVAAFAGMAAQAWAGPSQWTVDKAASKLGFRSSFAGQPVEGAFRRWDAQINFDPKALAASKVVVSVDMTSASTGDPEHDEALPTGDWFDAAHYSRATFTTTGFKDLGGGRYQAQGVLSLRGVAKPITMPFTLAINGDLAKMTSAISVNRSVFGVGRGQFKSAETVPFEVTVNVVLTARRAR